MTRRTVGTRSASSATSATWTTTSCSSTCAVTTTSATSATLTGPRTTTGGGGGGAGKGGGAGWPRSPLTPVPDSDYAYLREHFREKHFLCEEGRCSAEQFTHAFRTDIDLKAHRTACHSRSRAEARQNRQIDLQFSYAPRHSRRGEGERGPPSAVRGSRGGSQPRRPDSGPDAAFPAGRLVAAGGALGVLCGGAPPEAAVGRSPCPLPAPTWGPGRRALGPTPRAPELRGVASLCPPSRSTALVHADLGLSRAVCWLQGSSVARTTRRWTGTTARVVQAGPAVAEPSRAAGEAGGTRGGRIREPLAFSWHHL